MAFAGKALAEIELKLIVVHALRHFKFSTTAKMEELKLAFGLTTFLNDYPISVQSRDTKT